MRRILLLIAILICQGVSGQTKIFNITPKEGLDKARLKVREFRYKNPNTPVTVYFDGGRYDIRKMVEFTSQDSGSESAPISYEAKEGAEPTFAASVIIKKWTKATDTKILAQIDDSAREHILVADLTSLGVTDLGDPSILGLRPELFIDGQLQSLARYPNAGHTIAGEAKGETNINTPWYNINGTKEGIIGYNEERIARWSKEEQARIGGYWYWDWAESHQEIEKIDTATKTIYIKEPYHKYGYKSGLKFYGLNLLCEMDSESEYYIDRNSGKIYWYAPTNYDPVKSEVSLSLNVGKFMVSLEDCSYVTFKGLTFKESRSTALSIKGGQNCTIDGCSILRQGSDAIHLTEGKNHTVTGSLMRQFGQGAIKAIGGNRKTLEPANYLIENNIIEYFSLFKRTYEPAVYFTGTGLTIRHNKMRYSSSSAMRLDGNDVVVEYNEISHVVNESDDQGGVDMWFNVTYGGIKIRNNYWHNIVGGTHNGAAGVRLDDMISGVEITGNVFEKCGAVYFGAVQIHGGKDNLVENNLFYDCYAAVSFTPWGQKRWIEFLDKESVKKLMYEEVDALSPLYQSRYPYLKNIRNDADKNYVKDNLIVDCKNVFLNDAKNNVLDRNTVISSEGVSLKNLCENSMEKYGFNPINFSNIGVKNNRYAK